ncbi:MAG TPA: hypothetical protein VF584_15315 [Longimicrobium sp.]|jgi:hypothetical protein
MSMLNPPTRPYMRGTTPRTISHPVRELCRELSPAAHPQYLQVTPEQGAQADDSFGIVERHVERHGGSVRYGWRIWEWPGVMIEAEFHAVWEDAAQQLHDLTPALNPVDTILFLPDPARAPNGKPLNNVRRALSPRPEIQKYIQAADAEFELMNRGSRAEQYGEITLSGDEAQELIAIQRAKMLAYRALVASTS